MITGLYVMITVARPSPLTPLPGERGTSSGNGVSTISEILSSRMKRIMRRASLTRWRRLGAAGFLLLLVCGCGALNPAETPRPNFFALDGALAAKEAVARTPVMASSAAPTLVVSPPRAAAGFDSQRIIYLRQAHALEHYAYNEWVDTPARMLAPLIVAAVERSAAFRAVVQTPSTVAGDMRLDTEVMRLQHEFLSNPSRVRFTLRAYLVDIATRRVLGSREFEAVAAAPSEDPYGGVIAANEAARAVLDELAAFCAEAARSVRARSSTGEGAR